MFYHLYELGHAVMRPARAAADSYKRLLRSPYNPMAHTSAGRSAAAACEVMERVTRRYKKPEFNIKSVEIGGSQVPVTGEIVWRKPFCDLIHFRRERGSAPDGDPRVLIVAPMSGHHATLLRGTVQGMLPAHDVYITDWTDARQVSAKAGRFDLDAYIEYVIEIIRLFEGRVHVMAVCQPSVPVLAAVAHMAAQEGGQAPDSMILMGGPIDTRRNPTAVNDLAQKRGTDWFRRSVIAAVPWGNPGAGRAVYPGFLQLTGFMSMNLDRHMKAHKELFFNLMKGNGDSIEKHTEFYDEYLAVMDLTAEFFLQTIELGVCPSRAGGGANAPSRRACRSGGHYEDGAVYRRRRKGRHHRTGPMRGGAYALRQSAGADADALCAARRWALRDFQRRPLPA